MVCGIATLITGVQFLYPDWRTDAQAQTYLEPEICDDGVDNDGDGLVDAADPDCPELTARCDIEVGQPSYVNGETVTVTSWRLANLSDSPAPIELKSWLSSPEDPDLPYIRFGERGGVVLPVGFDVDIGPINIGTIDANDVPGNYAFSCRLLDPVTGDVLYESSDSFGVF
jgi:hypothetical protein